MFYPRSQPLQQFTSWRTIDVLLLYMNFSSKVFWKEFIIQRSIHDYTNSIHSLPSGSGDVLGRRLSECLRSLPLRWCVSEPWVWVSGKPGSYLRKKLYYFFEEIVNGRWIFYQLSIMMLLENLSTYFLKYSNTLVPLAPVSFSIPSLHRRHTVVACPLCHSYHIVTLSHPVCTPFFP